MKHIDIIRQIDTNKDDIVDINLALNTKVDKVIGKDLSTNDFTDANIKELADAVLHMADTDIHITAAERVDWNAKETVAGAQAKADAAKAAANTYTDTKIATLKNSTVQIVNSLSSTDLPNPEQGIIYIVKDQTGISNLYTEYIFVPGTTQATDSSGNLIFEADGITPVYVLEPEIFGEAELDLSGYALTTYVDNEVAALINDTATTSTTETWSANKLTTDFTAINSTITSIQTDIGTLQTDVSGLQADVAALSSVSGRVVTAPITVAQLTAGDNTDGSYTVSISHNLDASSVLVYLHNNADEEYFHSVNFIDNDTLEITTYSNAEDLIATITKLV